MSAALAILMMAGTMVGMGAKEASIQAEKDREQAMIEKEAQEEQEMTEFLAQFPEPKNYDGATMLRDLAQLERSLQPQLPKKAIVMLKAKKPRKKAARATSSS